MEKPKTQKQKTEWWLPEAEGLCVVGEPMGEGG